MAIHIDRDLLRSTEEEYGSAFPSLEMLAAKSRDQSVQEFVFKKLKEMPYQAAQISADQFRQLVIEGQKAYTEQIHTSIITAALGIGVLGLAILEKASEITIHK